MPPRTRRSRADWLEAALTMVGEVGLDGLAVEPLAKRLSATKGSFYWHFRDRADLRNAVLGYWRDEATAAVIDDLETAPTTERLARLLSHTIDSGHESIEHAIITAADDPTVGPVVDEVHELRIGYLDKIFRDRGFTPARANARARVAYATYLGHLLLLSRAPEADRSRLISRVRAELMILLDA